MMRGTVYVIPVGKPELTTREVRGFREALTVDDFRAHAIAALGNSDLLGQVEVILEFGPIGEPWFFGQSNTAT